MSPCHDVEVEPALEPLLHVLLIEVLVQAVVAAIEEALVADRPRERVGTDALIADIAELDVLAVKVHWCSPLLKSSRVNYTTHTLYKHSSWG